MTVVSVAQALAGKIAEGGEVTVRGWVRTVRGSANLAFVNVSDGSGFHPIQAVATDALGNFDEIKRLTPGCSVIARGQLVKSQGKGQSFEIQADAIEIVGWVEDPLTYPIQPKPMSPEFLREVAHLRPRTNLFGAVTRIRDCLAKAVHRYFHENGYYWISTPIVTTSDAEGAGQMFRVSTLDLANLPRTGDGQVDFSRDFFGKETFLTVSGQLNVEAYCLALSKVYTFGPTFRAENSHTTRHLAEFWMVEPEIAFADLAEDARVAEDFLKYLFRAVLERAKEKFEFPVKWGMDLQSEHERYLTEKHARKPVVVMNYPKDIKAFYMRLNDDGRTVAAMDVLAPGIGEIIGGSQREERLDVLDARMAQFGLDPEHYGWYRDFRRYGSVPHAGFGLGFERLVVYVCGLSNIRDAIPYPRAPGSAEF